MEGRIDFSGILDGELFAGSDVEITPTLSTGTKIADYEIDGVAGELYAPSGGGGSTVDIDPTISTGTKIADYEIDGVAGELYAPTPISNYNELSNKPTINNVTLQGDITINEVPDSSQAASGDVLTHTISGESWLPAPKELPTYTAAENGKFLGVDNGILAWLEAGGSGGNAIVELARSSTFYVANQNINLNDSIDNYDLLLFSMVYQGSPTAVKFFNAIVTVADFKTASERFYTAYAGAGYNDVKYVNDTTILTLRINGDVRLQAIYGIKLTTGGGTSYAAGYGINISSGIISADHYKYGDTVSVTQNVVPALVKNNKKTMVFNIDIGKPIDFNHIGSVSINYLTVCAYDATNDTTTTINIISNGSTVAGFNVSLDMGPSNPDNIRVTVTTVDPYPALNVESNGTIMLESVTMTMTI